MSYYQRENPFARATNLPAITSLSQPHRSMTRNYNYSSSGLDNQGSQFRIDGAGNHNNNNRNGDSNSNSYNNKNTNTKYNDYSSIDINRTQANPF